MFSIHRSIIADRLEEVAGLTARCGAQEGVSQSGSFPFGLGLRVGGLGIFPPFLGVSQSRAHCGESSGKEHGKLHENCDFVGIYRD